MPCIHVNHREAILVKGFRTVFSHKHFLLWEVPLGRWLLRAPVGAGKGGVVPRGSVPVGVQVRVGRGGGAEKAVVVEALEGLQGQSEASSGFGCSVWSLPQLQDHLGNGEEADQ